MIIISNIIIKVFYICKIAEKSRANVCIIILGGCSTDFGCTAECNSKFGYPSGTCEMRGPAPRQCVCRKFDC